MVHFEKFPYWQKIPCISPLFENNEYITDFKKKAELLNSFFANHCSLINNNSQLPPTLSYKTNERFSSVKITNDKILEIIAKLDPNKVHGHDKISICMIKMLYFNLQTSEAHFQLLHRQWYISRKKKLMLCQFTKKVTNKP